MEAREIRQKFLDFFATRNHKIVPSSSLIPSDPSVLLTTAGMQQFKSYYTGVADPVKDFSSKNVASVQKSFRTSDIDEVGDESHLTFFEMLGNFSFGGYGKEQAIKLAHEFITQELGLPISCVTVFSGGAGVEADLKSKKIWQTLGVTNVKEEGLADVFWGPTGASGPCGPTTEIYCKNTQGREVEIWNIVFNQFFFGGTRKELLSGLSNKKLESLSTLGVDTGMGLERLAMIVQKKTSIFETDLFQEFFEILPADLSLDKKRILADHARAVVFLIADSVRPDNKGSGYVLRRLLRRVLSRINLEHLKLMTDWVINKYGEVYPELPMVNIWEIIAHEHRQFEVTLELGFRKLAKIQKIDVSQAFKLYESHGVPFEVIKDRYSDLSRVEFEKEFERHQIVSRARVVQKFSGGLADHDPKTVKLHTAHHLLLAALQQLFGKQVKQRGSNINQERLRFDFSFNRKLTDEEKKSVENIVNEKIRTNLTVVKKEMSKTEAEKLGAEMEFGAKYGDTVSVYFIGEESGRAFSIEFCGGPHVTHTGELGIFKIIKEEAVAQGIRRLKAVLE